MARPHAIITQAHVAREVVRPPGSQIKRGANRAYVLARLRRDGRTDLIEKVESGALSVRRALAVVADKQTSR
jgi:hypothetical protein